MRVLNMKRNIYKNENGVSPIIETFAAVGISVVLLAVFFTSANNLYTVYDTPIADLQAKSIGIMETLLNSPGQDIAYNPSWESDYQNVSVLGLGTSQTIAYGIVHIDNQGESTIKAQYNFSNSSIGIATTCFLEGTKIVMADCLYKNIEDIKVGDMVKSFDEENGRLVDRRVTCVFHHAPEEMGDYYLVINDFLRITPNHLVYSNGRWIEAGDLKIDDSLFYPSLDYMVYSIERVYERVPTYDFEVGVSHNYFVALDTTDILVHNQDPPVARFTWFDNDGPYRPGTNISFNAKDSESSSAGGINEYWWDFDDGNGFVPGNKYETADIETDSRNVTLKVVDSIGEGTVTHIVQANIVSPPDVDEKPWVLTGKDVYPDQTFVPYGKDHYIKYTSLEESYYLFEIKEKTTSTYNILDFEKIENLSNVYYSVAKSALGIESESAIYEFSITIVTTVNEIEVVTYSYGASNEYAYALESTTREILVYHKPTADNIEHEITNHPYYETGQITVCVFIGGLGPNYPPYTPSDPSPTNDATGVARNADLSWTGGDPNPRDTVTYDVYFGTSNPPPKIEPGNQSASTYDPGTMEPSTTYYWQIVAWDSHDNKTEGPTWSFTTGANKLPNTPSDPDPENGANHVSVITMLSWSCSDPDGDPLSYDVYYSTVNWSGGLPPIPKLTGSNFYDPNSDGGRLEYDTTYYWMIGAKDGYGIKFGPIWNFTTAEKGLDQYNTEGTGEGLSTKEQYLGQTFTAGRTGNLTNINLSLKYEGGGPPPDVTVNLYECGNGDPNDPGALLATTIIESFDGTSFVWENAIFDTPVEVTVGHMYFIEIPRTGSKSYSWQYSYRVVETGDPASGSNYPGGDAWNNATGKWVKPENVDDFLFKTYVFREPEINQSCLEQTGTGTDTTFDLAQTFKAGRIGDLMKVNLSFECKGSSSDVITVEIYSGTPTKLKELLATTTIEGFSEGDFVWKEAVFSNVPFLKEGEKYSIVIPNVQLYKWEMNGSNAYREGDAWQKNSGDWLKLVNTDFIFATYMDGFG